MASTIIPNDGAANAGRELQAINGQIGIIASDVGMACELLEDAFSCMGGDRLQRGQVELLIYAIAAKASALNDLTAEIESISNAKAEVSHG